MYLYGIIFGTLVGFALGFALGKFIKEESNKKEGEK